MEILQSVLINYVHINGVRFTTITIPMRSSHPLARSARFEKCVLIIFSEIHMSENGIT
jgi:hypothetical protein